MIGFNPYLNFNGNCREALHFYRDCFQGEIMEMQTFGEARHSDETQKDQIMHSSFRAGSIFFMASDSMAGHPVTHGSNITLNINFDDIEKQENVFNKLAMNGKVRQPLVDTFWGARFGILTDRFGINWMVNCQLKK